MDAVRVMEVVETTLTKRGKGVEDDPVRCVRQYWSREGELLAEVDPCPALDREKKRLKEAILWALGERDEFPERPSGASLYWWRIELRRRAGLGD
jgi:hypothetical protein